MVEARPQVLCGVGPPRAPGRASLRKGTDAVRQPQLLGRKPNAEIRDWKGIGVAKTTHSDDLSRPGTDTGQCRQLFPGAVPVATRMEHHTSLGQRLNQRDHGALASLGEGQVCGIDFGKLLDRGKDVRQTASRVGHRPAIARQQAGRDAYAPP